jgi:hypothetical protein
MRLLVDKIKKSRDCENSPIKTGFHFSNAEFETDFNEHSFTFVKLHGN